MKRIILLSLLALLPACNRSCGDVWEDSKTCFRYMGQGMRSLAGKHPNRHGYSHEDFAMAGDEEFIPLADEDLYHQILVGDRQALQRIDADTPIPQAREGAIPGIEGFFDPLMGEMAMLFTHVHFDTDDYAIKTPQDLQAIRNMANYLKSHPEVYVYIEGHCDERGPAAYNLALGSRRSNALRNQLIKEGVDLDRLFTVSYGKERPIAKGHDSASWSQNRRGQFKIYQKA